MMYSIQFYIKVVQALEEIGAPYMIVGAFAGFPFGITRATYDIDILVDLRDQDFDVLSEKFPLPRYYADPVMMQNSVRMGIMFNIIDSSEGIKADLVPLKREPKYLEAFDRRIRKRFSDGEVEFEAWCARPEDIIIGKLQAWAEGESNKHPADISAILTFLLSDVNETDFDLATITNSANRMGERVYSLWCELLERAKKVVQDFKDA